MQAVVQRVQGDWQVVCHSWVAGSVQGSEPDTRITRDKVDRINNILVDLLMPTRVFPYPLTLLLNLN